MLATHINVEFRMKYARTKTITVTLATSCVCAYARVCLRVCAVTKPRLPHHSAPFTSIKLIRLIADCMLSEVTQQMIASVCSAKPFDPTEARQSKRCLTLKVVIVATQRLRGMCSIVVQ